MNFFSYISPRGGKATWKYFGFMQGLAPGCG